MKEIYLDNGATTRPFSEVVEQMTDCMMNAYGNPSSLHRKGFHAEQIIKTAREQVAQQFKVSPDTVYFCSGGTEANNWAIMGGAMRYANRGRHLITTCVEHASVLETFRALEKQGFEVTYLPVDRQGKLSLRQIEDALRKDTIMISVMHVNNEIGNTYPIREIGALARALGILFHVDAIQSFCKIPTHPIMDQVDLLSCSAHKVHGPKGIGALYIREKLEILPLLRGGAQEKGRRAGTENVPGIIGFGAAVEKNRLEGCFPTAVREYKTEVMQELQKIPGIHFHGVPEESHAPILCLWFEGVDRAEVLLHMLEGKGIYVSSGSACHSKNTQASHVLQSLGLKGEALHGSIRLSVGYYNSKKEIPRLVEVMKDAVAEYRQF